MEPTYEEYLRQQNPGEDFIKAEFEENKQIIRQQIRLIWSEIKKGNAVVAIGFTFAVITVILIIPFVILKTIVDSLNNNNLIENVNVIDKYHIWRCRHWNDDMEWRELLDSNSGIILKKNYHIKLDKMTVTAFASQSFICNGNFKTLYILVENEPKDIPVQVGASVSNTHFYFLRTY